MLRSVNLIQASKNNGTEDFQKRSGLPSFGEDLGALSPEDLEIGRQQVSNY